MLGIRLQLIGLITPPPLLARLCWDDAGAGLKAKKNLGMPYSGPARLWEVVCRPQLLYFSSRKVVLFTKFGQS